MVYIYIIAISILTYLLYRILSLKEIDNYDKYKALFINVLAISIPVIFLYYQAKDYEISIFIVTKESIRFLLVAVLYGLLCARFVAIFRNFSIAYKWPFIANNLSLTVFEDKARRKSKIPPVVKVEKNYFRIKSLGIAIKQIKDNKEPIERALGGIYINAVVDAKGKKDKPLHDCIDIYYSLTPLPSMITFADLPYKIKYGKLIFGRSEKEWIELTYEKCRHLGIAGESGGGKTCFLLSLITQLVCTNSQQPIVIVDFKGSYAFRAISKLSHHVIHVTEIEDAITILNALMDIHHYRAKLIGDNFEDIYKANEYWGEDKKNIRLDHIWLFIDEADELIPESEEAKGMVKRLCQLGRSTGIHVVLATQRLSAQNMGGPIKEQLKQIAFKLNQPETSRLWIGDTSAHDLPNQPGIAVIKYNGDNIVFQSLYIEVEQSVNFMKNVPCRISRTYDKLQSALNPAIPEIKAEDYDF